MLRRLSIGLLASAIAISQLPLKAQEGSAEDLGVMSISLKDVVKPRVGFQGALQGAGTPNQAGIGGFLPLKVNDNSVWFLDALANVNFADRDNYSSIISTTVDGATVSTSTRLGYRWLNGDRSVMYGINAGYDTRPMATGYADTGIPLFGTEQTVFFQQAAINAEAVSDKWRFNAYGLIPVGEEDHQLNWFYKAGALTTIGADAGYSITPSLLASLGGYYQNGDVDDDGNPEVDNVGIKGRLAYAINNDLTLGANLSYDEAFDTRFSADITWRFNTNGGPGKETPKTNAAVNALSSTPSYRDVRVHDFVMASLVALNVLGFAGLVGQVDQLIDQTKELNLPPELQKPKCITLYRILNDADKKLCHEQAINYVDNITAKYDLGIFEELLYQALEAADGK